MCSGKVLKNISGFSCLDPGLGAKVGHGLVPKAGNLDQKANLNPSLIGAPVRVLGADRERDLLRDFSYSSFDLLHPQRPVLCPLHQKELQDPVLDLVQSQGHDPDQVPEINPELSILCTLLRNTFLLA